LGLNPGVYYPQSAVLLRIRWEKKINGTESEDKVIDIRVQCKRVKVSINDYTQADTFNLEIDYKNFPFDPRCIRSVAATIAMENMGKIFDDTNGLIEIAVKPKTLFPNDHNVIFIGFADEEKINFDDTKRTVTLEGRDYTSLLIDKKYTKGAIGLEKRVDAVLTDILSDNPETKDITLDLQVPEDQLLVLSKFWGEKDLLSGKRSSNKDETYWDVIQDICRRSALIAYIELDKLVLAKPRNLYDKSKAKKFVYGRNLKTLEMSRKIGRKRGFNIIVRSLDLGDKGVLTAKIPAEATQKWSEETGISNTEVKLKKIRPDGTVHSATPSKNTATGLKEVEEVAPYQSFLIADVKDKDHLIEIGQQIYEEIGRQEIEGTLETKVMSTAEGDIRDPREFNLLRLRNGTPIQVYIEQGDMQVLSNFFGSLDRKKHEPGENTKPTRARIANYLISRGWPQNVATLFADRYNDFSYIFYTRAVEFSLDSETGFSCKVDFVNFIETIAGTRKSD